MTKHTNLRVLAPALAVLAVAACDFEVTNPGPTQDSFLDSLNAHDAVVTGAREELREAMGYIFYWGAAMTFEINPAGSTGSFGIMPHIQDGRFNEFDSGDYTDASEARWVAEDAFRRFERVLPEIDNAPALASYEPAARALVYAGYANRLLGENFCSVTFDGGPIQPHTDAYTRAEGHFTQAISIATAAGETDLALAAQAGRASVRANLATYGLANWGDAASDAQAIASDFVFVVENSNQDQDQYNYFMWANGNEPYRAHTVWGTFYEDYYTATSDPRVPWIVGVCPDCPDPANPTGDAAVDKFGGNVAWYPQQKYDERESPFPVSSGWEMRLIEAEALLAGGNFAAAAAMMDQRRVTDLGLAPVAVTDLTTGWTALKTERAIELWLEGRRMGDIRRWLANGIPGDLIDVVIWDSDGNGTTEITARAIDNHRAYPIGRSEREVNENVPIGFTACTS